MIETKALSQLLLSALSGEITWLEASRRYSLNEFIEAFYNTRAAMEKVISDLTDEEAAYTAVNNPMWSLSETVTHLVFSQNGYFNALLDLTSWQRPHLVEAAKGFGEGARHSIPANELRQMLSAATAYIKEAIEMTKETADPLHITRNPLFGDINYNTWMLLMLGHEVDHVRQSILMRRMARAATIK
jgi:uncharacterized damage-inducible protein DinB